MQETMQTILDYIEETFESVMLPPTKGLLQFCVRILNLFGFISHSAKQAKAHYFLFDS